MKKIALYFGSFNPIHIGHLIIANMIKEYSSMNEIWFVVSPQNPFKEKKTLLADNQRLEMVYLAIKNYPHFRTCDIEFNLPKPSYTIDTLAVLREKYPDNSFTLIMGEDNLVTFHKWKNYKQIIKNYSIIVYPRIIQKKINEKECKTEFKEKFEEYLEFDVKKIDAPIIEISSTKIREMIHEKKNIRPLVPPEVFEYLEFSSLYL